MPLFEIRFTETEEWVVTVEAPSAEEAVNVFDCMDVDFWDVAQHVVTQSRQLGTVEEVQEADMVTRSFVRYVEDDPTDD